MIVKQLNDPTKELGTILVPFVNNSSGVLVHGDVVVKDHAAMAAACAADTKVCPEYVTTTTAADSSLLAGVVYAPDGKGIAVGATGTMMIRGYHDNVKVNGTVDIAVGDFLSTMGGVAKVAAKANATKVVGSIIGIALEAYTNNDSNGTIRVFVDLK